jgi:hypothetical protein
MKSHAEMIGAQPESFLDCNAGSLCAETSRRHKSLCHVVDEQKVCAYLQVLAPINRFARHIGLAITGLVD